MSTSLWVQWAGGWWWWVLRVLGFSHMHALGDFGQRHPSLRQGCLKEKTLENLEKYVVKDVSCADPHGPLPTLPSSVNSSWPLCAPPH